MITVIHKPLLAKVTTLCIFFICAFIAERVRFHILSYTMQQQPKYLLMLGKVVAWQNICFWHSVNCKWLVAKYMRCCHATATQTVLYVFMASLIVYLSVVRYDCLAWDSVFFCFLQVWLWILFSNNTLIFLYIVQFNLFYCHYTRQAKWFK